MIATEPHPSAAIESAPTGVHATLERVRDRRDEGGYVMAMTALLLIPLLIFAAFAVDVGAWYVEAQQIQQAADAASLAGVVWMPDETKAREVAIEVAAINGYVDEAGDFDDPGVQVRVVRVGNQQLRVDIRAPGELYFGSVIENFENPQLHRFAVAEYILPVPLGNPTSALGTAVDTGYGQVDNFWLTGNPECEIRANGDFIGARAGVGGCDGGNSLDNYRPEGHTFVVDVPAAGNYVLQARMTCFVQNRGGTPANPLWEWVPGVGWQQRTAYPGGSTQDYRWRTNETSAPTRFQLYPRDDTPLDNSDNVTNFSPVVNTLNRPSDTICGSPVNGYNGTGEPGALNFWRTSLADGGDPAPWVTIGDVSAAGRHVLQVKNMGTAQFIWNKYSLRVVPISQAGSNAAWSCSRVGPSASATCPNLYAVDFMTVSTAGSMYNDGEIPNDPAGLDVELYLAEVDDIHAGKRLEITMFDPADGIEIVRVLDPSGTPVDLTWESIDVEEYGYTVPTGSYAYSSDFALTTQQCGGTSCITENRNGEDSLSSTQYNFQDRTVRMYVELPTD